MCIEIHALSCNSDELEYSSGAVENSFCWQTLFSPWFWVIILHGLLIPLLARTVMCFIINPQTLVQKIFLARLWTWSCHVRTLSGKCLHFWPSFLLLVFWISSLSDSQRSLVNSNNSDGQSLTGIKWVWSPAKTRWVISLLMRCLNSLTAPAFHTDMEPLDPLMIMVLPIFNWWIWCRPVQKTKLLPSSGVFLLQTSINPYWATGPEDSWYSSILVGKCPIYALDGHISLTRC